MIQQSEFLVAMADLSLALIAFATIVVALRQMSGGGLNDLQLLVVKLFTACGFCAVFFSLLPILVSLFQIPEPLVWRVCNPPLAVAVVLIHFWYFHSRRRVAPNRKLNAINFFNMATMLVAVALLTLGTLGIAFDGSMARYGFALVGLLVAAATAFMRTLPDFLAAAE